MAEQKEYKKLRELIVAAIGDDRTQADFARETGITTEHLNRLLKNSMISRPHDNTLMKIAEHSENGITLKMLRDSCDYRSKEYMTDEERIDRLMYVSSDSFKWLGRNNSIYPSLESYVNKVLCGVCFYTEEICVGSHIGDIIALEPPVNKYRAESAAIVTLTTLIGKYHIEADTLIYFSETTGGKVIICQVFSKQKDMDKYGSAIVKRLREEGRYEEDAPAYITRLKDDEVLYGKDRFKTHAIMANEELYMKNYKDHVRRETLNETAPMIARALKMKKDGITDITEYEKIGITQQLYDAIFSD